MLKISTWYSDLKAIFWEVLITQLEILKMEISNCNDED